MAVAAGRQLSELLFNNKLEDIEKYGEKEVKVYKTSFTSIYTASPNIINRVE